VYCTKFGQLQQLIIIIIIIIIIIVGGYVYWLLCEINSVVSVRLEFSLKPADNVTSLHDQALISGSTTFALKSNFNEVSA